MVATTLTKSRLQRAENGHRAGSIVNNASHRFALSSGSSSPEPASDWTRSASTAAVMRARDRISRLVTLRVNGSETGVVASDPCASSSRAPASSFKQ